MTHLISDIERILDEVIFINKGKIVLTSSVDELRKKMLRSIIIGVVLYLGVQTLSLGFIAFYGLFNPDVMNLINTTDIINIDAIKSVMYFGIGIYVLYSIVLYFIGLKYLNKCVNVE